MSEKKEIEFNKNKFKLLLMFADKQILTGVDIGLRSAVQWFLDYSKQDSEKLLEYNFKTATMEYWERWENQLDEDQTYSQNRNQESE